MKVKIGDTVIGVMEKLEPVEPVSDESMYELGQYLKIPEIGRNHIYYVHRRYICYTTLQFA